MAKRQRGPRDAIRWLRPVLWPLLLPLALVLALYNKLSPVPLKIHMLRVDRIGHLGGNTELFCSLRDLGRLPRERRVFVYRDAPCNAFLVRMWSRVIPIRQAFLPLFDLCYKLGGLGVTSRELEKSGTLDFENLMEKTPQHLDFTADEEQKAAEQGRALGLEQGRPFVSVLGRDSLYLIQHNPHEDNSHYTFRNVDINTYVPALERLAERFTVVRVGSTARDLLQTAHPRIIDYPFSGKRSEILDIYLAARCHFYITCGTGPDTVAAQCFRRPTLWVNLMPPYMATSWGRQNLTILKHYWSPAKQRYLTLSELLSSPLGHSYDYHAVIKPSGAQVVDNTPEEIQEAADEMVARLDGTWVETPEDRERQEQFWRLFKPHFPNREYVARMGAAFLRNHPHWLR